MQIILLPLYAQGQVYKVPFSPDMNTALPRGPSSAATPGYL